MQKLFLTLNNTDHSTQVLTELYPVEAGKKHSFSWEQKCIGKCKIEFPKPQNKIDEIKLDAIRDYLVNFGENAKYFWEKLTNFVGLELRFFDKEKTIISQKRFPFFAETHLGLIGTDAWRDYLANRNNSEKYMIPCSIDFEAPKNAKFSQAAFIIEPWAKITTEMIIENIKASEPGSQTGKLSLSFYDSETGKAISARLSLTDKNGNAFFPDRCVKNNIPSPFFYCLDGKAELDLPPGKYTVEAVKGFEYLPLKKEIEVRSGSENVYEFQLTKGMDIKKNKWINGDHHLHICGHAKIDYPLMTPPEALKTAEAEDMDYIPFQADFIDSVSHENKTISSDSAIAQYSCELVNHIWGHYCCIFNKEALKRQICGHILYPTMLHAVKEINASGGYCIAAHPYGMVCNPSAKEDKFKNMAEGIGNPGRWNCAKELPLILLHGEKCAYDLLPDGNLDELEFGIKEYYRLLNFGFRIPVGGSTDTGINSASSSFPGCRTFVKADKLSFESIIAGFRNGKTFASNGPLINASIDGNFEWGDILRKKNGEKINIKLKLFSPWGMNSCQIICNGETVEKIQLKGQNNAEWETEIISKSPGWLAVRIDGPQSKWMTNRQIAHSSPIYLEDPENPFKSSQELSDYYRAWLKQLEKIASHYKNETTSTKAWEEIISNIEKGKTILEEISSHGWNQ